jgi:import inner membrane translocase subunit TIM16
MMGKMGASRITPMTKQEAVKILGIEDRMEEKDFDFAEAQEHFERMFLQNDPEKGGSFYVQSKIFHARDCLEKELVKSGVLSNEQAAQFRKVTEEIIKKKPVQEQQEAKQET